MAPELTVSSPVATTRTILYVDDEPDMRAAFEACFAERFDVVTAPSGAAALEVLAGRPVAVLLADQRMPGMSGVELCQAARGRFPDVVRMIVTGHTDASVAAEAINSGQVLRFVFKPWHQEQMTEVLRVGLEAHALSMLVGGVQARLARRQQATTSYLLRTVLHDFKPAARSAHLNLLWIIDTLHAARLTPEEADRVNLEGLLTAVREALQALDTLAQRIDSFRTAATPATAAAGDVGRAVQAAAAIVGPELRRLARLELELAAVPPVAAETVQVTEILVNLLSNAVEAFPPERTATNLVTVRGAARDGRAEIQVEDSGPGIPAELLPRIFDPFVSTRSDDPARGCGLAMVRELVQELGGEITVRSELGRGTCFSVALPLA